MTKKEQKTQKTASVGLRRAMPVILLAIAAFIGICYITKNNTGMLGHAISEAFLGLFSVGAYAIPVLLAVHALFFSSDVREKRLLTRSVFSVLTVIFISVLAHSVSTWGVDAAALPFDAVAFYNDGTRLVGGGFIGGVIGYALMRFLGHLGVILVAVVIFAVYVAYFFSRGSALREAGRILMYGLLTFLAIVEKGFRCIFGKLANPKRNRKKELENNKELADDDFFDVDNGMAKLEISGLGIVESRSKAAIETNPTLHEKVYHNPESKVVYDDPASMITEPYEAVGKDEAAEPVSGFAKDTARDIFVDTDAASAFEAAPADFNYAAEKVYASDSADGVFTVDFDPYDLAANEKLAAKMSTKVSYEDERTTVTETVKDTVTESFERMKMREDFERRKAQMIEEQHRRAAEREAEAENAKKNVEFRVRDGEFVSVGRVEEESVSVTIGKYDRAPEAAAPASAPDESSIYSTVYSPIVQRTVPTRSAEPVNTEFRQYSVPKDNKPSDDGLIFEFDQPEGLKIERTLLKDAAASGGSSTMVFYDEPSDAPINDEPKINEAASMAAKLEEDRLEEPRSHSLFEAMDDEEAEDEAELDGMTNPEEDGWSDEEIPPEKQNPFITEARGMFDMFRREEAAEAYAQKPEVVEEDVAVIEEAEPDLGASNEEAYAESADTIVIDDEESDENDDEPPFDLVGAGGVMQRIENVKKPEPREMPKKKTPDYRNYKMPPLDLLGLDPIRNEDEIGIEIKENTKILIETLASFNVTASIKGVDRGPRVTRYEVVPARGVKVNQVTHLFDDIKLALAAEGVRMEAPIPGRSAIGFEIPNKHPKNVRLRELLECEEFAGSSSTTYVCLGKDVAGNPVFGDIAKFPHALVAGATGMGKSVCINSLLISMLYKARPDEVRFILIDPKKVEFKIYSGIPHLLVPVVTEAKQAAGALMWAVEEMERRYDLIEKYNIRNIQAYNERVARDHSMGAPLPKIVIVIDELNDLMMQVRDPAEDLIMRIAQKARAAGIHLIIGTQRPDVKVITGTIKANIGTRISCKVTSVVDSRTILEMAGAEKLLNKGDMLYKPTDRTDPVRVQGCFVSDEEVEAVMEYVKQFASGEQYDEEVLAEINKAAQKCGKEKKGSQDSDDGGNEECGYYSDQQFLDAVELAIRSGKVSTSLLQRKLQIGFGKAARFIDGMEEIGIVSEPNGQKPRDVLVTMDEWREKLSRVDLG